MVQSTQKVEVQVRSSAAYFRFFGDFDREVPSPHAIASEALQTKGKLAILDLSAVASIDSDGLEILERIAAYSEGMGVKIRVVAPHQTKVRRILDLVRFDRFLIIAASLLEAVRFGRRARTPKTKRAPGEA